MDNTFDSDGCVMREGVAVQSLDGRPLSEGLADGWNDGKLDMLGIIDGAL